MQTIEMSAAWFGIDLNASAEDDEFAASGHPAQHNDPTSNVAGMDITSDTGATIGSGVPTGDTLPTEDSGSEDEVQSTPEGFKPKKTFHWHGV